jgi:transposase
MEYNTEALAKTCKNGRPRVNDRTTINGIMFVLVTGCRWTELPAMYGSKSAAHRRFQNLQEQEIWKKTLSNAIKSAHKSGKLNLQKISVDSTSIPAKKEVM